MVLLSPIHLGSEPVGDPEIRTVLAHAALRIGDAGRGGSRAKLIVTRYGRGARIDLSLGPKKDCGGSRNTPMRRQN
jgi:hypothetical protein